MKSFINGLLKFWQFTLKTLSEMHAQHLREQEQIALNYRVMELISELYFLITQYPMVHKQYQFCCLSEEQIHYKVLSLNRFELEVPILNIEPLQPYPLQLFEKEFLQQFDLCRKRIGQQYGYNAAQYFPMLYSIERIKVFQEHPGFIRMLIIVGSKGGENGI